MGNTYNILLVFSDISAAQHLNKQLLMPAGHHTKITSNQQEAKKNVRSNCPSLLILSENQEDMSALELANYFLQKEPALPIIIISSKFSDIKPEKMLLIGNVDILAHPLKLENLKAAVSRGLQRNENWQNWLKTYNSEQTVDRISSLNFDNFEHPVVTYDFQGKITVLNKSMREELNLSDTEAVGKNISEIFHDPNWLKALKGDHSNLEIIEVSGINEKAYQISFSETEDGGVIASFFDISKLIESYKLKTDIINTVSHDLRSPLTSIFGYLELIKNIGDLSDDQKNYLGKVLKSAQNIKSLIDNILSLGSVELGKDVTMEMLAFNTIIQEAIDGLQIQAANRNQTLNYTFDDQLPDIPGNPIQLRQMVDNLIGNAIKYTQRGGRIDVSVTTDRKIITFKVVDNGAGIPEKEISKIFNKYYRTKNVDPESAGTGLGLAISKAIIEKHHGRIKVESVVGKGSEFIILLPTFS